MKFFRKIFVVISRSRARLIRRMIELLGISDREMEILFGGEYPSLESFEILKRYSKASSRTSQHPRDDLLEQMIFPDRFLYKIRDVSIDTMTGTIFTSKKRIIPESSTWPRAHLLLNSPPKPLFPHRLTFPIERTVLHLPSNGFYHWLFEDLPPYLFALENSKKSVTLIHEGAPAYVDSFIPLISGEIMRVPRFISTGSLTSITKGPNTGWVDPIDLKTLKTFFKKHIGSTAPGKKIYISRLNSTRSPSFEKELIQRLNSEGWVILQTELMSMVDQIGEISTAEILCGVHGAGLSGIAWMSPGTTLIELSPRRLIPCFARICNNLNNNYFRIPYEEPRLDIDEIYRQIQTVCD